MTKAVVSDTGIRSIYEKAARQSKRFTEKRKNGGVVRAGG
jgi:hypothetical protein